jgi:hypothetical protein
MAIETSPANCMELKDAVRRRFDVSRLYSGECVMEEGVKAPKCRDY